MIKLLKLQRPLLIIVVGILAYIASKIIAAGGNTQNYYLKEISGALLIVGACWVMYPILFAKKDNDGNAKIITDPKVEDTTETEIKPAEE